MSAAIDDELDFSSNVLTLEPESQERGDTPSRNRPATADAEPRMAPNYHVIIWNDDVHTFEYVIELLMELFGHTIDSAIQITKEVDKVGKGIAKTCHQELAELKREQVISYGPDLRSSKLDKQFPIRCTIEPVPE